MSLIPIKFACGHELIDNGCGDYVSKCPKHEQPLQPWLHLGIVMDMVMHHERFACHYCGPLGRCIDGGPITLPERPA